MLYKWESSEFTSHGILIWDTSGCALEFSRTAGGAITCNTLDGRNPIKRNTFNRWRRFAAEKMPFEVDGAARHLMTA